jgi:hypothetical protein
MARSYRLFLFAFGLSSSILTASQNANAQTYLETYGQNRVQLRKFDWKFFETTHFRVYHYDRAGKDLARFVAEQAELDYAAVKGQESLQNTGKINIITYNSYGDYQQSNIGRAKDASQLRTFSAGNAKFIDSKFEIWFTGVHADMREQIRAGLSDIFFEKRVYSTNKRQKSTELGVINIPSWIEEGFTQYTSNGWTEQLDKDWKNVLEGTKSTSFYLIGEKYPEIAGAAFWKFIRERYGKEEVKDLMSSFRHQKNFGKTIKNRFDIKVLPFFDSTLQFFRSTYAVYDASQTHLNADEAIVKLKIPTGVNTIIKDVKVSPRGADIAYTKWQNGVFQVCLKNTRGEQHEAVIIEGGEKNYNQSPDPNYPLLAWSNTGYRMAVLYQKGTQLRLRIYDAVKATSTTYVVPNNRFDRALSIAIDEENNGLIISAIRKSQTDIFHFTFKGSRLKNITNDAWSDVEPSIVSGGSRKGIIFLSNRTAPDLNAKIDVNQLPTGAMNAFFYETKTKSSQLVQLSFAQANEEISKPIQYGSESFAYLSNKNGTTNKYIVQFRRDKFNHEIYSSTPEANLSNSIVAHQYSAMAQTVSSILKQEGGYTVYIKPIDYPSIDQPTVVTKALLVEYDTAKIGINPLYMPTKSKSFQYFNKSLREEDLQMPTGNVYQTDFESNAPSQQVAERNDLPNNTVEQSSVDSTYIKLKAQPYRTAFRANDVSISLDNTSIFNRYQPASFNGNNYANPQMGGLITLSMDDILENYRVSGGFKLPFAGQGSTYFLQFENVKKRLDWSISAFRSTHMRDYNVQFADSLGNPVFNTFGIGKNVTNIVMGTFSYPFDKMRSLRLQIGGRADVLNFKGIDSLTLELPRSNKYWATSRLELVYDNTRLIETNIRNGSRYKFFGEYMHQMNDKAGGMYALGFDVRAYQKLYWRNVIWAFRIAGAVSGGKQKVLYTMGGVDNWINYSNEPNQAISTLNYGFQTVANTLRGFRLGARTGSSYSVMSNEIRIPILHTLLNRPVSNRFLRSLQFVPFADVGVTWDGFWPNTDNIGKSLVISQFPVTTTIQFPLSESISIGYGAGLRADIASYQVRLDAGWNKYSNGKPLIHLSFGTDF